MLYNIKHERQDLRSCFFLKRKIKILIFLFNVSPYPIVLFMKGGVDKGTNDEEQNDRSGDNGNIPPPCADRFTVFAIYT
jgi:hypothetical protein